MPDIDALKKQLLEMQTELRNRVANTEDEERAEVQREGERDNAHLWEQSEVRDGLDDEATAELREISQAMARMDSGDYGYCVTCGEEIPEARLEAVPYAITCIKHG